MSNPGNKPRQIIRNDHSSTAVTTGAYVELDSALDSDSSYAEIFDSSGETLLIAVGAAGSEDDQFYIMPGGNGRIPLLLNEGMRLSVKAVSANTSTGELVINLWG